jgi:NADP-dependent 3-hydroxy acid dehydrogenase YdfG
MGSMAFSELFRLDGRVALITGASSRGIGSAAAKALAEYGAKVFLVARRAEKLESVVRSIRENGGTAECWAADV